MTKLHSKFIGLLKSKYPSANSLKDLDTRVANIVSAQSITLPKKVLERAQHCINQIYPYSQSKKHVEQIFSKCSPQDQDILNFPVKNHSVLSAYDFHYDPNTQNIYLIEINTNAAAFLLSELMYDSAEMANPFPSIDLLKKSFQKEFGFINTLKKPRIAIIDEAPDQQKMYVEFLMYKDFFEKMGLTCEICDFKNFDADKFDYVYNRYTDFTFSRPDSIHLREAYLSSRVLFSPHPRDYILFASKERMIDFYNAQISDCVLETIDLSNNADLETIWSDRKKYFFKPKRSFGAKSVYKGGSISRSAFAKMIEHDAIAQQVVPADDIMGWKYDLRFYTYENEIQNVIARSYQGQVTNFSHLGGGLTPVIFN